MKAMGEFFAVVTKALGDFFAIIDTAGGHMVNMNTLIVFAVMIHIFFAPNDALVHDLAIGAIGVLFGSLRGENGAKKRLEPKTDTPSTTTVQRQTVETTTPDPPVAPDAP